MNKKRRIVIAEDHTIIREGLRALLSVDPLFEIVGEAEDGRDAIRCVETLMPDLVLMDLSMPKMDGMEAIREIKQRFPETKILALTVHKTEEHILAALRAGADGYAVKDASHAELSVAIKSILSGKSYLSPGISGKVIEGYLAGKQTLKSSSSWDTLSWLHAPYPGCFESTCCRRKRGAGFPLFLYPYWSEAVGNFQVDLA